MEKRLLAAIGASVLVLVVYSFFFAPTPKPGPDQAQQPQQTAQNQPGTASNIAPTPVPSTPLPPPTESKPARTILVTAGLWHGNFTTKGGLAKDWTLEKLPSTKELKGRDLKSEDGSSLTLFNGGDDPAKDSFKLDFPGNPELSKRINAATFDCDISGNIVDATTADSQVNFTYTDPSGVSVKKTFVFSPGRFDFRVMLEAKSGNDPIPVRLEIGPGFGDATAKAKNSYTSTPPQVMAAVDNKVNRQSVIKDGSATVGGPINWAAISDHYFAFMVIPDAPQSEAILADGSKTGLVDAAAFHPLVASVPIGASATVYIGPRERTILTILNDDLKRNHNLSVDLEDVIDYGFFSRIVKPIVPLISISLAKVYQFVPNYGWSIIILTIGINLLFFPLKWKSSVSMKKMKDIAPRQKEIQEKMKGLKKDDPQYMALQSEQLKLMKEGNPLGGCLPMLIQMPIFWALFIYLTISIYVRQSPWVGWIHDLSSPDPYYILPIILCVSMIAQSAMTPTPTDSQQKMQKYMMSYGMPIMLTLLFFKAAPSGLVIYYMFSNLVGVGQQALINKLT
jgi:YidC/Oxa1 family membrane protein insertase